MQDYTTVKIDKVTLRLLIQFKALLERIGGISVPFNVAVQIATLIADWKMSYDFNYTKKEFVEYKEEILKIAKEKDEKLEMISLLEELDAVCKK